MDIIMRCKSIKWLLNANRDTSRYYALNFILYEINSTFNTIVLFYDYKYHLEQILYDAIPDMDCVKLIIQHGGLLSPFYDVFCVYL